MSATLINFAYLVASVLFILGLKGLTHPRTAVRGNLLGALGMLLAVRRYPGGPANPLRPNTFYLA